MIELKSLCTFSYQDALLDLNAALSHGTVSHPPMPLKAIHYIPRHRPPHARRDPVWPSTRAAHPQAVRVAQEHIARAHTASLKSASAHIARAGSDDHELSRTAVHSPRAGPERVQGAASPPAGAAACSPRKRESGGGGAGSLTGTRSP